MLTRALALCAIAGGVGLADLSRRPFTMIDAGQLAPPASPPPSTPPAQAAGGALVAAAESGTLTPRLPSGLVGVSFIDLPRAFGLFERGKANGDAAFIDARPEPEFAASRVPLAFHMPLDAFFGGKVPADLEMIPKSSAIVVYCGGGDCDASIRVAERLRDFGYAEIYIFEAGFPAWVEAGKPVEGGGGATGVPGKSGGAGQ
ncbi:MAG: rhodanese-like domain-containing protein [Phycisphaerales bacterium]